MRRSPGRGTLFGSAHSKEVPKTISLALALLTCCLWQPSRAADYQPQLWKNDEQGWVVEARECDRALCAFLVWYPALSKKPPADLPLDVLNPDPARRNVPLCGLQLIGGFIPSPHKTGGWDKGWVYDPDSGHTYSGTITTVDTRTIKLRGYVGVPLFGRTLTLRRVFQIPARCTVPR